MMSSQSEGVNGWASVRVGGAVHRQVQIEKENELVCGWAWKMGKLINEALIITII